MLQLTQKTVSQSLASDPQSANRLWAAMSASLSSIDPVSSCRLGIALGLKWTPLVSQPKCCVLARVSILGTSLSPVDLCFSVHWQTFPAYYASMPRGPQERGLLQAKPQYFLGHFTPPGPAWVRQVSGISICIIHRICTLCFFLLHTQNSWGQSSLR